MGVDSSPTRLESLFEGDCADIGLTYAALCTTSEEAARALVDSAVSWPKAHGVCVTGLSADGLPSVPRFLHRLHSTAAAWRSQPARAALLRPDYVAWLERIDAAPRGQVPLGLRILRDMNAFDAELLWWSRVEALPAERLAMALGWDAEHTAYVLEGMDAIFVECCRAEHMESARRQRTCRSYGGMLAASVGRGDLPLPPELHDHLVGCPECRDLSACLNAARDGTLGGLIASAVLGWGGADYVAARSDKHAVTGLPSKRHVARLATPLGQRLRQSLKGLVAGIVAAGLLGLVAVIVLATPHEQTRDTRDRPAPVPGQFSLMPVRPSRGSSPPTARHEPPSKAEPGPVASTSSAAAVHRATGDPSANEDSLTPVCTSLLKVVDDWRTGARMELTVWTSSRLSDWRVSFDIAAGTTFRDAWNGVATVEGNRVTVAAADYDRSVAAAGSLTLGLVSDGRVSGARVTHVALNNHPCGAA